MKQPLPTVADVTAMPVTALVAGKYLLWLTVSTDQCSYDDLRH